MCLPLPQEGFWDKAFPTAVGALIGGLVTLSALVLKEWFDRRRNNQAWYEQTYITDGVDRLIVYVSALDSFLANLGRGWHDQAVLSEPYPRESVERFRTLFSSSSVPYELSLLRDVCERKIRVDNWADQASESRGVQRTREFVVVLSEELRCLESALLDSKMTRGKSQVHRIRDRRRIKPILHRLEERVREWSDEFDRQKADGGRRP